MSAMIRQNVSNHKDKLPSRTVEPKFDAIILSATVKGACARYTKMQPDDPRRAKLRLALELGLRGARSLHHRCHEALKHWQKVPTRTAAGADVIWIYRNPWDHELTKIAIEELDNDIALIERTLTPPDTSLARAFLKVK